MNTVNVPHSYAVGDEVSYGFNGDYYPCGIISKITKRYITTDTGAKFYIAKAPHVVYANLDDTEKTIEMRDVMQLVSNKWFRMVAGHVNKRNPSF